MLMIPFPPCIQRVLATLAKTAAVAAIVATAAAAAAQDYPMHPIKLVLGFPPGGSTDIASRRMADQLARQLGQPVLVDNRPGASGSIGATYVAKSAADGYTLFYGTNTTHAMNVSLYQKLDYDPVKDFVPIVMHGKVWNVLSVRPLFEANTLPALIALAKAQPGVVNVATPGNSTSPHMALELLKSSAGIQVTHVPYKGSAAALTDVMGGQVSVIFDNLPASLPYIKAGRLKALAVSSPRRLAVLPDVPTFDELGFKDYEVAGWGAVWAPAGTPQAIVERLNREINLALKDPKVAASMTDAAIEPQGGTPEAAAEYAREETSKWREVIRAAGIKLN